MPAPPERRPAAAPPAPWSVRRAVPAAEAPDEHPVGPMAAPVPLSPCPAPRAMAVTFRGARYRTACQSRSRRAPRTRSPLQERLRGPHSLPSSHAVPVNGRAAPPGGRAMAPRLLRHHPTAAARAAPRRPFSRRDTPRRRRASARAHHLRTRARWLASVPETLHDHRAQCARAEMLVQIHATDCWLAENRVLSGHPRTASHRWGCHSDRPVSAHAHPLDGCRAWNRRPTTNRISGHGPRGTLRRRHYPRTVAQPWPPGRAARPDTAHATRGALKLSRHAAAAAYRPRPTSPRDTRPDPPHGRGMNRSAPSCRLAGAAAASAPLALLQHPALVRSGPRGMPPPYRSDRPQTPRAGARLRRRARRYARAHPRAPRPHVPPRAERYRSGAAP